MNMADVKLLGTWPSPYSYRVIWALKLKGIEFEYIEEDLFNKSALLLQSNPVHKKIPVLLHGGNSVAESTIILEYIDEMWPRTPLLPEDPHERSIARFWARFADEDSIVWTIYRTSGAEQEKAVKESLELLRTIEDYGGLGEKKFFGGDVIGLADLAFGGVAHWLGAIEGVVGIKLMEARAFPHLHAWMNNFKQVPVIKENLPNHDEMVEFFKHQRKMILARP